jgi:hypothetical protein
MYPDIEKDCKYILGIPILRNVFSIMFVCMYD